MPAIQNEYDDYGYIAMRRGTAKAAPRVSDSKNKAKVRPSSKVGVRTQTRTSSQARVNPQARTSSQARVSTQTRTSSQARVSTQTRISSQARVSTQTRTSSQARVNTQTRTIQKQSSRLSNTSANKIAETKRKNRESVRAVMRDKPKTSRLKKPEEMSLKSATLMSSPNQKAKRNTKTLKKENVIKNTALLMCIFSLLLLVCYRASVINESHRNLSSMKKNLAEVQATNAQIESDIQMQTDLSEIEIYAKYQLGMEKPKEEQIKRISFERADKISTPVIIEEEKETTWDKIVNEVLKIFN